MCQIEILFKIINGKSSFRIIKFLLIEKKMKFIHIIIFSLCLASSMTQSIGLSNLLTDTASAAADSLSILGLGSVIDTLS